MSVESTPHGRWGQGPGSVDPLFPAGLPFPVPEILEFVAFRDSGKIFEQFSPDFPGVFLRKPQKGGDWDLPWRSPPLREVGKLPASC